MAERTGEQVFEDVPVNTYLPINRIAVVFNEARALNTGDISEWVKLGLFQGSDLMDYRAASKVRQDVQTKIQKAGKAVPYGELSRMGINPRYFVVQGLIDAIKTEADPLDEAVYALQHIMLHPSNGYGNLGRNLLDVGFPSDLLEAIMPLYARLRERQRHLSKELYSLVRQGEAFTKKGSKVETARAVRNKDYYERKHAAEAAEADRIQGQEYEEAGRTLTRLEASRDRRKEILLKAISQRLAEELRKAGVS